MRWYLFVILYTGLLLTLGACGSVAGPTSDERTDTQFTQDVALVAVLPDYEVYEVDVKDGTCYIARGYQSVGIHCIERKGR